MELEEEIQKYEAAGGQWSDEVSQLLHKEELANDSDDSDWTQTFGFQQLRESYQRSEGESMDEALDSADESVISSDAMEVEDCKQELIDLTAMEEEAAKQDVDATASDSDHDF